MAQAQEVLWHGKIGDHGITTAEEYLRLKFSRADADLVAAKFREHRDRIEHFMAKDILRSAELPLLPVTDVEVAEKLAKIRNGEKLHPVLLVRDKHTLYIADGYHRICACYHRHEETPVHCVLVHL